ncbi:MAG: FAD-dependent oxidoreductase [Bacteroidota bacterium]
MRLKIIGAGIVGICTAVRCLEAGHSVQMVYAAPPSQTTSAQAGAIWLPYLAEPKEKVLPWSKWSHQRYQREIRNGVPGVKEVALQVEALPNHEPSWLQILPPSLVKNVESHVDRRRWEVQVPLITPLPYLQYWWDWLSARAAMEHRMVHNLTMECTSEYDWIINCTGLGSRVLCQDSDIYPVRGQLVKLGPNQDALQFVEESKAPIMTYVFSRDNETLIGGTAEAHVWENQTNPATLKIIYERAVERFPDLQSLPVIGSQTGLRPVRKVVRVEQDERSPIIHHYGHGGSGYTLAWGSAQRVLELL